MKIAVITDMHFGARNNSSFFCRKMLEFFDNTFFPYLLDNNIKHLLVLGDSFDSRKSLDINILNTFTEKFFERLYNENISVYMVLGNHDITFRNSLEVNSIKHIEKQFSNIKLIKEFEDIKFDNITIGLCSWITPDLEKPFYNYLDKSSADIICGHFEIENFEMTKGHPSEEGLEENIFSKFKMVLSGHYHVRNTRNNITYISNQLQTNWGDCDLEKGFAVIDTDNISLEYVNNPVYIYKKIEYNSSIDIVNYDYSGLTDTIVRVYVISKSINDRKFDLFIDKLSSVVHKYDVITINTESHETELVITDEMTDNKMLINSYIDSLTIDYKDNYKEMISSLYDEALEKIKSDI